MNNNPATRESYASSAEELAVRIERLIPEHPEILEMDSVWDLFRIPGFKCDDLAPSLAQAGAALAKARSGYRAKPSGDQGNESINR